MLPHLGRGAALQEASSGWIKGAGCLSSPAVHINGVSGRCFSALRWARPEKYTLRAMSAVEKKLPQFAQGNVGMAFGSLCVTALLSSRMYN